MNGKQKKYLRGLAHDMKPMVHIGRRGLTAAVASHIDTALADHELIKVRVSDLSAADRKVLAARLADDVDCEVAGAIGKVLILYRADKDNPRIVIPETEGTEPEEDATAAAPGGATQTE